MGLFGLFWVIFCDRFRFSFPDIDAYLSILIRDVHRIQILDERRPKQLRNSWFYVIFYNLWRRRLAKRSKAASRTGQMLLKNTNISITKVNWRVLRIEIWNICEIDCIFRLKLCKDLFIQIALVFYLVYNSWLFQLVYFTPSQDRRRRPLTRLTGCKIRSDA